MIILNKLAYLLQQNTQFSYSPPRLHCVEIYWIQCGYRIPLKEIMDPQGEISKGK